jgi:uncharacterized repeat protein (TIGR01451 family)
VQLFYGTSQAGPLDIINKDFFRGSSVDFAGLSTVAFGGALALSKTATVVSGPAAPVVGQPTTYDLQVTARNTSIYPIDGVRVTDTLPEGVSVVSATAPVGTVSRSGSSVTWSGFRLLPGESRPLVIRVTYTPTSADVGSRKVLNPGASGTATREDGVAVSAASNAVSSTP